MPLTPEVVQKKTFTPVRLREGYDMGEVDQFLDEVELELSRLIKENESLRAQLDKVSSNGSGRASVQLDKSSVPPQAGQVAPPVPQPGASRPVADPTALPVVRTAPEASSAAVRLLEIATNNAEQLVNEAQGEADRLIGGARTKAERLERESKSRAERLEAEAKSKAEQLSAESRSKAQQLETETKSKTEQLEAEVRTRAEHLDAEITERRQQLLGDLEREKKSLSAELDELRAFESEYRGRLKSYFENQLLALEGTGGDSSDVPSSAAIDAKPSGRSRSRELIGESAS